jgi:hypothetical protein
MLTGRDPMPEEIARRIAGALAAELEAIREAAAR